jgi:hypothetical protein
LEFGLGHFVAVGYARNRDPRHPSSLKPTKIQLQSPTLPSPTLPRVYAFSIESERPGNFDGRDVAVARVQQNEAQSLGLTLWKELP